MENARRIVFTTTAIRMPAMLAWMTRSDDLPRLGTPSSEMARSGKVRDVIERHMGKMGDDPITFFYLSSSLA